MNQYNGLEEVLQAIPVKPVDDLYTEIAYDPFADKVMSEDHVGDFGSARCQWADGIRFIGFFRQRPSAKTVIERIEGPLAAVMTASEAAERWGISPRRVQSACTGRDDTPPRFVPGEARKAGGTWLVTVNGMERVFGSEPEI